MHKGVPEGEGSVEVNYLALCLLHLVLLEDIELLGGAPGHQSLDAIAPFERQREGCANLGLVDSAAVSLHMDDVPAAGAGRARGGPGRGELSVKAGGVTCR